MDRKVLKEIILANELIDEGRLRELEALSVGSGSSLLETIVQGGYIREEKLLPLVAQRFGVDWIDLAALEEIDPGPFGELPTALRTCAGLLPLYRENGRVVVAVSDITEVELIDRLRETTGWSIRLVYASQEKLDRQREILEGGGPGSMKEALSTIGGEELGERSLEEMANEAPIIKLVNLMIMQAISEGASDIHIEPYERQATVRYRVDGVLRETATYPAAQYPAIVSRVKIMADLDIAERRVPQDGRISLRLMDREYDLRVASVPVLYGEGVVMRILDKGSIMAGLGDLGFSDTNLEEFRRQIAKPHGIVLVTGPTGSGKTTTLYATLSAIKSVRTKIITIEDPVEYQLDGINQIHVNPKVGLSFAAGLRSILRLDPDIIMVGEIRDTETAEIAIRASLTGHAVFSTLHTNDALSAVTRLLDMNLPPYLISSTLNAVLAQRLVRCICEFCRKAAPIGAIEAAVLEAAGVADVDKLWVGAGCEQCNESGYSGRTGIHELLQVDERVRRLVNEQAPAAAIRAVVREAGMRSMREDGVAKMVAGVTTAEEVLRVTQGE